MMYGYGLGFGGLFLSLIVWAFLIALLVLAVRAVRRDRESETPLSILKRRYASGEIGKGEYEDMKRELA